MHQIFFRFSSVLKDTGRFDRSDMPPHDKFMEMISQRIAQVCTSKDGVHAMFYTNFNSLSTNMFQ